MTTLRAFALIAAAATLGACSTDRVIDNTVDAGAFATKAVVKTTVGAGRLVVRGGQALASRGED